MPDGHCADPSLPLHLDQGRGSSKKESFSLRVSPALHPPERPSPRRVDMAGHGHGSGRGTEICIISLFVMLGYSEATNIKPLPGILKQVILITMRNPPQSHPNINTIIL